MFFKFVVGTFIYAIATATLFTTEINQDKIWIYFGLFSGGYAILVATLIYKVLKRELLKSREETQEREANNVQILKLTRDRGSLESSRANSSDPPYLKEQMSELREQVENILKLPANIPTMGFLTPPPKPTVNNLDRKNPSRKASLVTPIPIILEDQE